MPEPSYASSSQWSQPPPHDTTPSPTTSYHHQEADNSHFPRMGVLLHASELEYQRHIIYWKQYYSHMSWERYMMQLLDEQAQQMTHDHYARQGSNNQDDSSSSHGFFQPSRHSTWW